MSQKIFEKETSFTDSRQCSILRSINKLRPLTQSKIDPLLQNPNYKHINLNKSVLKIIKTMIKYKRFQIGWIIVIMYVVFIVWMTFAYINQWGNNPIDVYGYIFFMTFFSGILLAFYGITIIVTDKHLIIKFGVGFYTKKIELASINKVTVVKTPFCYGYGIRIIPNGLLYNLGRKDAIEINLKKKKQVIQIGTNDLENLKEAFEKGLSA